MLEVRCQCLAVAPWSAAVVPETTAVRSGVVRWLVAFSLAIGTFTKKNKPQFWPKTYIIPPTKIAAEIPGYSQIAFSV